MTWARRSGSSEVADTAQVWSSVHHRDRGGAIRAGSKSFALASRLFAPATRRLVWDLYTWCRHCDDVVDGQTLGHGREPGDAAHAADTGDSASADRAARVVALRHDTDAALAGMAGEEGPFAALQRVAQATRLPALLTRDHLDGFAMDAAARRYDTIDDTLDYGYHVAGVVGLMMAWVMGVRDRPTLARAADLGMAFQLTNIARDVGDDVLAGRIYVPAHWLAAAGAQLVPGRPIDDATAARLAPVVAGLLDEADRYYESARHGLPQLAWRSAWAVATAHHVYRDIGVEVRRRGAHAWRERVVTSRPAKIARVLQGGCEATWTRRPSWSTGPLRRGLYTPATLAMLG